MKPCRSKYFDNCLNSVKNGYSEFATDLILNIQKTLKNGDELNLSQQEYLIECFDRILNSTDSKNIADKAFYLKSSKKGPPKKATGLRDQHAALKMFELEGSGLSFEEKLQHTKWFINPR